MFCCRWKIEFHCSALNFIVFDVWGLVAEDIHRFELLDLQCLHTITRIGRDDRISNARTSNARIRNVMVSEIVLRAYEAEWIFIVEPYCL